MVATVPTDAVVGTTVAVSFILLGNAITQSFMGVPALLVDFPKPSSPEHASAVRHLGRQWPVFWNMGNVFFRPISTLSILSYGYAGYATYLLSASGPGMTHRDWRVYALAAACHLLTAIHSAVNMQPINAKIDALRESKATGVDTSLAEYYARKWIRLNGVRIVMPLVAGTAALWQTLRYAY